MICQESKYWPCCDVCHWDDFEAEVDDYSICLDDMRANGWDVDEINDQHTCPDCQEGAK